MPSNGKMKPAQNADYDVGEWSKSATLNNNTCDPASGRANDEPNDQLCYYQGLLPKYPVGDNGRVQNAKEAPIRSIMRCRSPARLARS
jgi:hypothetical protein